MRRLHGRPALASFLAVALCMALVAPGCSSPGPGGGFARGDDDAAVSGSSSGGGDDATGAPGNPGAGGDGQAAAIGSDGGKSASSSGGPTGLDAAKDAPSVDARAPEAGSTGKTDGGSSLDAARQACVDRINMYRATIGVAPLTLAPASIEACSDTGAMHDATTNSPHSSAGTCPGTGAQDTCPDLPVGGFSGATLLTSLAQCLDQMWAEGPPPTGTSVAQCIQDYQGCFLKHGHYINMSDSYEKQTGVSCGFYLMSSGAYWGNQDFLP